MYLSTSPPFLSKPKLKIKALTEWKEYDEAVKKKDLAKALRILKSTETPAIPQPPSSSLSPPPSVSFSGRSDGLNFLQPVRDWEVLDACLNADDMKLVGNAYKFLQDRGFLPSFGKRRNIVAVAMPNLGELLEDTPTHIFASVWFEWRKTKHYSIHYSELIRLAALYKYGGLYLDSDIIVLKPLSSLNNSIGMEDEPAKSSFNGAVMKFSKNSPFIMECLREFYSTYDDNLLRWNGADLLTRTVKKFLTQENNPDQQKLKIQPSSMFFPISPQDITRYFAAPTDETERAHQHILLLKILDGSYTFHFWNGLTSSIIPEPESLVAKLLNHHCIHCHDVL